MSAENLYNEPGISHLIHPDHNISEVPDMLERFMYDYTKSGHIHIDTFNRLIRLRDAFNDFLSLSHYDAPSVLLNNIQQIKSAVSGRPGKDITTLMDHILLLLKRLEADQKLWDNLAHEETKNDL